SDVRCTSRYRYVDDETLVGRTARVYVRRLPLAWSGHNRVGDTATGSGLAESALEEPPALGPPPAPYVIVVVDRWRGHEYECTHPARPDEGQWHANNQGTRRLEYAPRIHRPRNRTAFTPMIASFSAVEGPGSSITSRAEWSMSYHGKSDPRRTRSTPTSRIRSTKAAGSGARAAHSDWMISQRSKYAAGKSPASLGSWRHAAPPMCATTTRRSGWEFRSDRIASGSACCRPSRLGPECVRTVRSS